MHSHDASLFTLDSTTLFFYDLSNNARASQTTNQTVDEWAQGIPANAKPRSGTRSVTNRVPSLTTSKSSRTQTTTSESTRSAFQACVKVKGIDDGGLSDQDERIGGEADLARNSPLKGKVRVNSKAGCLISLESAHLTFFGKNLVRVGKEKKPKLTKEEKKLEKKNHPLLGTKEFRNTAVPTTFIWAAAQVDPWNLGGDTAIRRAFQKIADVVWIEGSENVDDLVMTQVTQRFSDTWRAPISSAALMIVHTYFESQSVLKDSEEARQEYSRMQLQKHKFLYGRLGVSSSDKKRLFHGPLVVQTFAQHLHAIKGAETVLGLKHTCATEQPYGALVLASVAVKRALTFWATKQITIKAVREADKSGNPIRFPNLVNEKTGIESNSYAQFSQLLWGDDTKSLMASAQTLTDNDFDAIIKEAQKAMKARRGDSGESTTAPPEDLQPMEISDDDDEEQWLANFAKSSTVLAPPASRSEDREQSVLHRSLEEASHRRKESPPPRGSQHHEEAHQRREEYPPPRAHQRREEAYKRHEESPPPQRHEEAHQHREEYPPPWAHQRREETYQRREESLSPQHHEEAHQRREEYPPSWPQRHEEARRHREESPQRREASPPPRHHEESSRRHESPPPRHRYYENHKETYHESSRRRTHEESNIGDPGSFSRHRIGHNDNELRD
ncbi:hypothetical protein JOM56_012798 [Amanita muscaria]